MKSSLRKTSFIGIFILVALLTACGLTNQQIVKTQSFGAATTSIGKLGEEEFVNIRNGIIEMNKELVAIDKTKTSDSLILDRPTFVQPTAQRIAACKALKLYGELLVGLSTETRAEGLQKAASALTDNTAAALKKDLSDEQKNAINKLVVGLGSLWIDKKKADSAKEIIPAYEQPIGALADLLMGDFSIDDDALGYLKAYEVTAKRLKTASMRLVNAGSEYTVLERARAVQAFVLAEEALIRAGELSRIGKEVIVSLKKANTELVQAIKEKDYSTDDIKVYAKQIQGFVNTYQALSK